MAPEPFEEDACDHFLEMAGQPKYARKPIKEVIMDGHVISGCGNIYATEALFTMNIHPGRTTERISLKKKKELFQAIVAVLQESIDAGGSSISDYRNINGEAGTMQERLKMYGRKICVSMWYGDGEYENCRQDFRLLSQLAKNKEKVGNQ